MSAAPALLVQTANGGADLIVGIAGDVFHQEVDKPGIALQDGEHLKSAIAGPDFGLRRRCGCGLFLGFPGVPELLRDFIGEFAPK